MITRTLRTLSNVRVRNVATVGGHLAHADPHMDLPPVLIALGAHVRSSGRSGERTIPVAELFAGYFETVLAQRRTDLRADRAGAGRPARLYLKCTTRAVHDWPALGVAVSLDSRRRHGRASLDRRQRRDREAHAAGGRGEGFARRRDRRRRVAPRRRCGGRGGRADQRRPRLGRLQKAVACASMWRARCAPRSRKRRSTALMDDDQDDGKRAGRAARCRGSKARRRSPAAPNTCTICACRACCYGKIFRSTVAHGRIKSASTSSAARALDGVYRVVTIEDIRNVIPNPFYGPAFHDQPILADRQGALCRRAGGGRAGQRSACRGGGGAADRRRIRGTAGGVRRSRGDDLEGDRA